MRRLYILVAAVLLACTLVAVTVSSAGAKSGVTKRYGAMVARESITPGTNTPTLTVVAVR